MAGPSGNGSADMTSEPITRSTIPTAQAAGSARQPLRLTLKPTAPTTGHVDGGWWPRSRNLAAELPPLLAVLAHRLGPIERVSYQLADWEPTVRKIKIEGGVIRLGGFRSQRAHTIDVIGARLRLTLLVVPPEAPGHAAHQSLLMAGHRGNADSVADLLAARSTTAETAAEQRWETEAGHVYHTG
jgi:hypothetical protein